MRQLYLPMRIWDLPIRLFHWVLVALVSFSWLSSQLNPDSFWLPLHILSGLTIFALLLFRVVWGFIGSDTARFAFFLKGPAAALRHLAHLRLREPDTEIGHNAAGGWMVVAFLLLLAVQVGTGLCANDDAMIEGPLAAMMGKERSDWLTHIHHLNFMLIQIAVALHVLAIVGYRVLKGHDLVRPMLTGKKRLPGATRAPRMMHPLLALAIFVLSAGLVYLFVRVVS